jgi:hypothetical protein
LHRPLDEKNLPVHFRVCCDSCGAEDIQGSRYNVPSVHRLSTCVRPAGSGACMDIIPFSASRLPTLPHPLKPHWVSIRPLRRPPLPLRY